MRSAGPSGESKRVRWSVGRLAAAVLGFSLCACAAPGSDINLAPLYTRVSIPSGSTAGRETEVLGGVFLKRQGGLAEQGTLEAARPLWSQRSTEQGTLAHFLVPLGVHREDSDGVLSMLLPIYYFLGHEQPGGGQHFDLISLPGILWSRSDSGDQNFAWFPFGGHMQRFLVWDRLDFALFPLYLHTERGGAVSNNILFPVFSWTTGGGKDGSYRIWPLYGRSTLAGNYDRRFWLWPLIHVQKNLLGKPADLQEQRWMLWPLLGYSKHATYRAWTFLWPFFGWATDPRGSFWALDAPWPLVRLQGGGLSPAAEERTRILPFYSHFRGDHLHADSYLWPIVHVREEQYATSGRKSFYIVPFWQSWQRESEADGTTSSYEKLWPIYQLEKRDDWTRGGILALSPLWREAAIDLHYGWLWELYAFEDSDLGRREHGWLGLYRREQSPQERRTSFGPLVSRRSYAQDGAQVNETSLLFGLLRWRSSADGVALLAPAFPGPGWPEGLLGSAGEAAAPVALQPELDTPLQQQPDSALEQP